MSSIQCVICLALGFECDCPAPASRSNLLGPTQSYFTEDHGSGEGFEELMQYFGHPQSVAADMPAQPMSIGGLVHEIFGTEDIAMLVPHNPSDDYYDPGDEPMDTPEAQIASPLATNQASCPTALCQWHACGDVITCQSVPKHFKEVHGIKGRNRTEPVTCEWDGCSAVIVRNNFVRHIRECHLDHIRDRGHAS